MKITITIDDGKAKVEDVKVDTEQVPAVQAEPSPATDADTAQQELASAYQVLQTEYNQVRQKPFDNLSFVTLPPLPGGWQVSLVGRATLDGGGMGWGVRGTGPGWLDHTKRRIIEAQAATLDGAMDTLVELIEKDHEKNPPPKPEHPFPFDGHDFVGFPILPSGWHWEIVQRAKDHMWNVGITRRKYGSQGSKDTLNLRGAGLASVLKDLTRMAERWNMENSRGRGNSNRGKPSPRKR